MVTANGRVLGRPSFVAGVIARTSTESCSVEFDAAVELCLIADLPAGIPDTAFGEAGRVSRLWNTQSRIKRAQQSQVTNPRLPNYLRAQRRKSGLSQNEIAYLLGRMNGAQVSRYE